MASARHVHAMGLEQATLIGHPKLLAGAVLCRHVVHCLVSHRMHMVLTGYRDHLNQLKQAVLSRHVPPDRACNTPASSLRTGDSHACRNRSNHKHSHGGNNRGILARKLSPAHALIGVRMVVGALRVRKVFPEMCYTEKSLDAWHRLGTQKTGNTYNQPNRPDRHTSQTKHQAIPKGQPGRRITPCNTAAVLASAPPAM